MISCSFIVISSSHGSKQISAVLIIVDEVNAEKETIKKHCYFQLFASGEVRAPCFI